MADERRMIDKAAGHAIFGTGAHVETKTIFTGLDWKRAGIRPPNAPHSVYELLRHMVFWQDWAVTWLDGTNHPLPKHASASWPADKGPTSRKEWDEAVRHFRDGLRALRRRSGDADLLSKRRSKSPLEMLLTIASHNSYHAGQVVVLRQVLGAWPPPSGGLGW
jgi:uncharacterized damage-inducible protein DinB